MEFSDVTICFTSQVRGSGIQSRTSAVKKLMTKEQKMGGVVPDMSIKNEAVKSKWRE